MPFDIHLPITEAKRSKAWSVSAHSKLWYWTLLCTSGIPIRNPTETFEIQHSYLQFSTDCTTTDPFLHIAYFEGYFSIVSPLNNRMHVVLLKSSWYNKLIFSLVWRYGLSLEMLDRYRCNKAQFFFVLN
jgi:hypothetical protein